MKYVELEDTILIKNVWEYKRFSVSVQKADILNTTYKTAHLAHTLILAVEQ